MNEITLTLGGSVELLLRPAPPLGACVVYAQYEGFVSTSKGFAMAYTLPIDKYVTMRVDYIDAQGHPAQVDGPVTWETTAPEVADVEVDDTDSQKCRVVPGDVLGTAQISVHADADLGDGIKPLVTILDITTVAGEAVAGTISPVGEPQPLP